ncbi:MAG: hypothetical protein A2Y34_04680 [Spirochaetes bacterium GWC1_27_15]|nr:MAG: hypothetical protein A2Z98_11220 [Spirochaetes bacterium GWB1_27_13]OHD24930.1 MAG: hypothetical protein A2Y34_04680 [Spirochaetes bacterium GWC1_27_15]
MKQVFISYKYEDIKYKNKIKNWAIEKRLGDINIIGETEDVRQGGMNAIQQHLSPKLTGASCVLVLVGNDTHNSVGVDYEIKHAKSQNKKIIVVRIPQTTGAAPIIIRNIKEVVFDPNAIKNAIES